MNATYVPGMVGDKRNYAEGAPDFANGAVLPFTFREMQAVLTNYRFWIGLGAVSVVLAIAGPFGTGEDMNLPERLVYWSSSSLISFIIGASISMAAGVALFRLTGWEWFSWIMGGVVAGPPIAVFIWLFNHYIFLDDMGSWGVFFRVCGYTTTIAVAVSIIYQLIIGDRHQPYAYPNSDTASNNSERRTNAFLKRLPRHLGTDILSVSSQDHYLEVVTTSGSDLILMRLSDAIEELETLGGIHVHRSHWVASKHITDQETNNGQLMLLLSDGRRIPVSRSRKEAVVRHLQSMETAA